MKKRRSFQCFGKHTVSKLTGSVAGWKRGTDKSDELITQKCKRRKEKERAAGQDTNQPQDGPGTGHQLAIVAYRDGPLYCMCTMS